METIRCLDELRSDADLIARFADAAFHDEGDAEFLGDVFDRHILPLKKNEEVRAATFSFGTLASTLSSSSLMPSEKYSLSFSSLRFENASTAMDFPAAF